MLAKEFGYVLAIDQASNNAGVSLWRHGELVALTVLRSAKKTDPIGKRLSTQVEQLTEFLQTHLGFDECIENVIFEGVRSRLVLVTVGAFLTCPFLRRCKISPKDNFVESTSWKWWAKKRGATGPVKDIKGVKALEEATSEKWGGITEDEADSILIYLTWRDRT